MSLSTIMKGVERVTYIQERHREDIVIIIPINSLVRVRGKVNNQDSLIIPWSRILMKAGNTLIPKFKTRENSQMQRDL